MFLDTFKERSIPDSSLTSPSSAAAAGLHLKYTPIGLKITSSEPEERQLAALSEASEAAPRRASLSQYLISSSAFIVQVIIDSFNPLRRWLAVTLRTLLTLLSAFLVSKSSRITLSAGLGPVLAWPHSPITYRSHPNSGPKSKRGSPGKKYSDRLTTAASLCNRSAFTILGSEEHFTTGPTLDHYHHNQQLAAPFDSQLTTDHHGMDLCQRWRDASVVGAAERAASNARPSAMNACLWHPSQEPMAIEQGSSEPSPLLMLGSSSGSGSSLSLAGGMRGHLLLQSQKQLQGQRQQQTQGVCQGHRNHQHNSSTYEALQIDTSTGRNSAITEPPTLVQLPNHRINGHYDPDLYSFLGRNNQFSTPASQAHSFLSSTLLTQDKQSHSNLSSDAMQAYHNPSMECHQLQAGANDRQRQASMSSVSPSSLVLVSKDTLSDLTNKMKNLEEQVRVIPELQRRLEHVINDSNPSVQEYQHQASMSAGGSYNMNRNSSSSGSSQRVNSSAIDEKIRKTNTSDQETNRGNSPLLQRQYTWIKSSAAVNHINNNNSSIKRDEQRSTMTGGSLSLQTTPVKHSTPLDCGCQSFKEHLRYNSISRESRLNYTKYQSIRCTRNNNSLSPQPPPPNNKVDASTNTDLSMEDVVTRDELNSLMSAMKKTYSNISTYSHISRCNQIKSSSLESDHGLSGSLSGRKSSSPLESQTDSCGDEEQLSDYKKPLDSFSSDLLKELLGPQVNRSSLSNIDRSVEKTSELAKGDYYNKDDVVDDDDDNDEEDDDDDDDDEEDDDGDPDSKESSNGEEPCSLGSSYQDPSDFEEYRAYGESLDRRTKDFISTSPKLPNDLKFTLIRLNDLIKKKRSLSQVESASSCLEIIRKAWFDLSTKKDSQASKVKLCIDYIESMTKQLLNLVVNLVDSAGNSAMHYAASDCKLDIIKILLDTKVCDTNCRNKAGYTPIMLLALAELKEPREQEIARQLFSLGDVNIMAQSNGQTALMLAASHGRSATCELLLECGANPSLQDYDGSTALMCGSEIGHEEVVRCLLAHKLTDLSATDNDGLDALTIAMNNGHKKIGLMLYAAKNVPRMTRGQGGRSANSSAGYLGASLRRTRGKASNLVRRADSLLNRSRLSEYSHI